MSNRILDYPEATEITSNDYILLDNEGTGAKCIKASALNINMDNYTIKEARGAIASFEDGEDLPLAFMGAYITALQDLHGYDYPWVGGSGRNLFNMGSKWSGSASGLSFTTDDDYVTMNGTKSGANYVTPSQLYFDLPAGTYYAKAFVISGTTSNAPSIYVYSNQELTSNMLNTERSFTIESQTSVGIRFAFWNDGATYSNYKIGIVISKTYDIDKFYPYSNECPITGFSGVEVVRCGKNLWDRDNIRRGVYTNGDGTTQSGSATTNFSSQFIKIMPNTTYSITMFGESYENGSLFGVYYDEYKNGLNQITNILRLVSNESKTFTTPSNAHYVVFSGYRGAGTDIFTTANTMVCEGTPTTYEPYNGHTYSLTFTDGSNPLTVYGGTVDLVSGVLTVDRGYVDLGTLTWVKLLTQEGRPYLYRWMTPAGSIKCKGGTQTINGISNTYRGISYASLLGGYDNCVVSCENRGFINVVDASLDSLTAAEFQSAMSGVQLVYELATPLTYQLSKQQIKSLVGENNIFADTGDSVVDYRKLWVMPEM